MSIVGCWYGHLLIYSYLISNLLTKSTKHQRYQGKAKSVSEVLYQLQRHFVLKVIQYTVNIEKK